MPTVARILELAPTCCYLASNYANKQALMEGAKATSVKNQTTLIYIYWKILNTIYEEDNNYVGLQAPANYLWELCQKFGFKAANIVDGGGGGSVTPVTSTTLPEPYYFLVSASSFIVNGANTKTMPESWSGYNMLFVRNGITQSTVNTEPSYFSYDVDTRVLTISPAAITDELFALIPT